MGVKRGIKQSWRFNPSGVALGHMPKPELDRMTLTMNRKEYHKPVSFLQKPTYFRKSNFKDRVQVKGIEVPTELHRTDTIRRMGTDTAGIVSNASANVPIYKYQGHMDGVVRRFPRGSDSRHRKLERRRQKQLHAENVPIIMDRPLG
jgi:hypothetical protein